MITRLFSSAVMGMTITAVLFYVMHVLIEVTVAAADTRPPIRLNAWHSDIEDTSVVSDLYERERIPDPAEPPPLVAPKDTGEHETYTGIRPVPANPPTPINQDYTFGLLDGALVTVVAVRPVYPAAAMSRGLEGQVIVEFDVTEIGTVTNVVVIDSSNSIFERSAIAAAKKFRFRPRVFDGVAQYSVGVRRLFSFRLGED